MTTDGYGVSSSASRAEFVPAPWHLTGRGYVFVYRFSQDFVRQSGMLRTHLQPHFRGGFGTLMLVDYSSGECGPYHELLFIPGRIQYQGRKLHSISRIFVSSISSVINGRRNWGIPKDQAEFQVVHEADGSEVWRVRFRGIEIFRARVKKGLIPFPVHSALSPHTLMQSWEDHVYVTELSARGWGRTARIMEIMGDGQYFPDLGQQSPLLGVAIENFRMTFHEASVEPDAG
ncbi:acetoacetate decarboxylase family protein [Oligoflexus tunisiensis]|uniref:acetoacetate decarboxylase family protein n=1 Tax=Oligoflexus tunisiensis TaxID=708132 RepID=UPI00159F02E3|nr:acetoacetate decarboxylase family protein [Oligoflexus tunisiensis]